jgi:hypothetical protein
MKNPYSRVLMALSFMKGPNIVNWVQTQISKLEDDLIDCSGDEDDEDLWNWFLQRFQRNYISTTKKEDAFVKIKALKMKGKQLDKYITEHTTLLAELDWDPDSEMAIHTFQEELPDAMVKKIIDQYGFPDTMKVWHHVTHQQHSRYAMGKALGYYRKKKDKNQWQHTLGHKKKCDPDAMDVDRAQMDVDTKEKLLKSGSCFRCHKQGHMARQCPLKSEIRATDATPKKGKEKAKTREDKPPPYESIMEQISACSMEDRQKLLELFKDGKEEEEEEDF